MKKLAAVAILAVSIATVQAQERVPQQDAERLAKLFAAQAGRLSDLQIKSEVDPSKPFSVAKDDLGALIMPDRKLTGDMLRKARKDVIPVGQLWLRNLTCVADGKPTPNDRLRLVTVTVKNEDHSLPFFLLGVRKKGDESLELLVYAKDKEPLLVLPVEKVDAKQGLPIEFEATKGDNDTGILTLTILGKFRAKLTVARQ
jgi:hypothetical protein